MSRLWGSGAHKFPQQSMRAPPYGRAPNSKGPAPELFQNQNFLTNQTALPRKDSRFDFPGKENKTTVRCDTLPLTSGAFCYLN